MLTFAAVILSALFTPASTQRKELGTYPDFRSCVEAMEDAAVEYMDFTNIDLGCTSDLAPLRSPFPKRRPEGLTHD